MLFCVHYSLRMFKGCPFDGQVVFVCCQGRVPGCSRVRALRPFYEGNFGVVVLAKSDFDTGDAARMNARTGVVVAGVKGPGVGSELFKIQASSVRYDPFNGRQDVSYS